MTMTPAIAADRNYEVVFGPDGLDRQAYNGHDAETLAARTYLGLVKQGVPSGLWVDGVLTVGTDVTLA